MYCVCPRCGDQLMYITPGGNNRHGRLSARVLVCTNPAGCIGPLMSDPIPASFAA
jgi:hypothetical protein